MHRSFHKLLKYHLVLGSAGSAANQFNSPSALFRVATAGTIYVADTYNHRIMSWASGASSGAVVAGGNGQGTSNTQLSSPYGFTWDASTNSFIIVNYSVHTVVRWVLGASSWTLLAGTVGASGTTSRSFNNPLGVALDPYGNMYVCDATNHRIQFFQAGESNGTTIAGTTGFSGASATQLYRPYGAIIDSELNLYVADAFNSRIQKFSRL